MEAESVKGICRVNRLGAAGASLVAQTGKKICLQYGKPGFDPWVGKSPWRRAWQSTPVFLPGESPWTVEPGGLQSIGSQRELDMTE